MPMWSLRAQQSTSTSISTFVCAAFFGFAEFKAKKKDFFHCSTNITHKLFSVNHFLIFLSFLKSLWLSALGYPFFLKQKMWFETVPDKGLCVGDRTRSIKYYIPRKVRNVKNSVSNHNTEDIIEPKIRQWLRDIWHEI